MSIVYLPQLHIGCPSHRGGLSVFPAGSPVRGLSGGSAVAVDEREGAPVVEELVAHNRGQQPALLLAGELVEGGWQDRALVHDVVLAPGNLAVVSVSCVEQGRWQRSGQQSRRGRRASLLVRSAQTRHHDTRQSQVWERVSRYDRAYGGAGTGTLLHHLRTVMPSVPPSPEVLAGQVRAFVQALAAVSGRRLRTDESTDAVDGRAVAAETARVVARGVLWQDGLAHLTVLNPRHALVLAA